VILIEEEIEIVILSQIELVIEIENVELEKLPFYEPLSFVCFWIFDMVKLFFLCLVAPLQRAQYREKPALSLIGYQWIRACHD